MDIVLMNEFTSSSPAMVSRIPGKVPIQRTVPYNFFASQVNSTKVPKLMSVYKSSWCCSIDGESTMLPCPTTSS